eukprot:4607370-Prymnesium_polylepis.2
MAGVEHAQGRRVRPRGAVARPAAEAPAQARANPLPLHLRPQPQDCRRDEAGVRAAHAVPPSSPAPLHTFTPPSRRCGSRSCPSPKRCSPPTCPPSSPTCAPASPSGSGVGARRAAPRSPSCWRAAPTT